MVSDVDIELKIQTVSKLRTLTAYIIKCGFGADNQHYHPQQRRFFSTGKCHAIRP